MHLALVEARFRWSPGSGPPCRCETVGASVGNARGARWLTRAQTPVRSSGHGGLYRQPAKVLSWQVYTPMNEKTLCLRAMGYWFIGKVTVKTVRPGRDAAVNSPRWRCATIE